MAAGKVEGQVLQITLSRANLGPGGSEDPFGPDGPFGPEGSFAKKAYPNETYEFSRAFSFVAQF
ncbi:MAG: hypothetical protein ABJF50_21300 [Paracoccaceae bacterium]